MKKKTATKISLVCACINLVLCTLKLIRINKQEKLESVTNDEKD